MVLAGSFRVFLLMVLFVFYGAFRKSFIINDLAKLPIRVRGPIQTEPEISQGNGTFGANRPIFLPPDPPGQAMLLVKVRAQFLPYFS